LALRLPLLLADGWFWPLFAVVLCSNCAQKQPHGEALQLPYFCMESECVSIQHAAFFGPAFRSSDVVNVVQSLSSGKTLGIEARARQSLSLA
jgi:hypothetical protein